jgi:4-hydroxybenzoate polyprenyltransferase
MNRPTGVDGRSPAFIGTFEANHLRRWWIYQRERFPLVAHAPLVAVFSASAIVFSATLRGQFPSPAGFLVGFASALGLFLQLRIADEFKDCEDDRRYRPYRPVPRGLVTLSELGLVAVLAAATQVLLALWLEPRLLVLLVLVWAYLGLMTREFFVPAWLKAHPVVYMASHMVIMPLIHLYVAAGDWLTAGHAAPPPGLYWFLLVSFLNGTVLEIGRKIRAPQAEEAGVETYSSLWTPVRAAYIWLGLVAATALAAIVAAAQTEAALPVGLVLAVLFLGACIVVVRFGRQLQSAAGAGRRIEIYAGVWTLLLYVILGVVPRLVVAS